LPFFAYVCDAVTPAPEVPSPKLHPHDVALEDEDPSNEHVKRVQLEVNLATEPSGGGGGGGALEYESL